MPLTQEEMLKKYGPRIEKEGKRFKKSAIIQARPAEEGEAVVTITDGKVETKNVAKKGDWLVVNPTGEEYLISDEKMKSRYEKLAHMSSVLLKNKLVDFSYFKATGKIMAIVADDKDATEDPTFMASWGEPMILEAGDVLAMPIGSKPEVYRIEGGVFDKTYEYDA
jgi:hypothetical protein